MLKKSIRILLAILIFSIFNTCSKDKPTNSSGSETVTDIDGNVYHTITIGTQIWMVENLEVTHYRNGDVIPNIISTSDWANLTTGAYCFYNNDSGNCVVYGGLYNWYTLDDYRKIAPDGWHIPTDLEWQTLFTYLGGVSVAGGKLKEVGNLHWQSPNIGATNEYGFSALPGGYRDGLGVFHSMGIYGFYWTSTISNTIYAWRRSFYNASTEVYHFANDMPVGFSVRCVKD